MVSLAAILSASSSAEASCPCSAASPALWWSLASSFVDDGVGRGGGSSVGFFVCLVVGFGVGYGRGSSVSMMGFPSASLSARSRVPPSKVTVGSNAVESLVRGSLRWNHGRMERGRNLRDRGGWRRRRDTIGKQRRSIQSRGRAGGGDVLAVE